MVASLDRPATPSREGAPRVTRDGNQHGAPRPDPTPDLLTERLSRRSFLITSGIGLAALSLAGCDSGSDGEQTGTTDTASIGPTPSALQALPGPPAGNGVPGGRIVVGFLSEGNSWDPALGYTETSWDSICNLTFSPLYSYGVDEEPLPNAAAAMPEVSADGLVYTIPLKEGVTFHNGRAVTAADYKYAWERVLDPKLQSWASSYITTIEGAKERLAGKTTTVSGIRVVDDLTLEVTLIQPDVTFLYRAHPAVHGARAPGGGRAAREGVGCERRRRQRPVRAGRVRACAAEGASS